MENRSSPAPLVLSRPKHCLSRKNIDVDALKVMVRLQRFGFKAYLVGGSVRDLLLEMQPKDFDISTDARPGQIKELFRNCRIIGRRFRLAHILFRGNKIIEVSTFRRTPPQVPHENRESSSPRKRDNTFGEPHEDAVRRDFTFNGLFYDISTFSIIDYVGGINDLNAGIVRTIGDADDKFQDDPLRMVRAVRHSVRTGFSIEKKTHDAMLRWAPLLKESNTSRLQDEFQKDLCRDSFGTVLYRQKEAGLLHPFFEELDRYLDPNYQEAPTLLSPAWVWKALSELDSRNMEEKQSRIYRLACILFPLLEARLLNMFPSIIESLPYAGSVHEHMTAASAPLGIPRRDREWLKTLWSGWIRLHKSLQSKFIPVRLQKRPYFQEVLLWHRFHGLVLGCPPEETEEAMQSALRAGRAAFQQRRKKRKSSNRT